MKKPVCFIVVIADEDQETLTVESDVKPKKVRLWMATANKCDFRDSKWKSREIEAVDGRYVARVPHPQTGCKAFFGEAVYSSGGAPFFLSTQVKVLK